ncbi:glucose dehydrogenase, putative [Talaromyces stipitatus ATCC 10500]|uniref:Glucose dehydrogenase, putative n=1 Tax=Talaromyces stipitatus (strain ATCC 10500 / CBS 375.48 / QM 6759 / NRRL 1006) TaxID=441959 RepID=B8LZP7_TALSN|nr:glucose dehydrogenase, putative [Talaromyces stipitatus ATCC 10500]EED22470.1 glucose dehydrogenase, putative [Talaromyces stipitatus ATCC 10500]
MRSSSLITTASLLSTVVGAINAANSTNTTSIKKNAALLGFDYDYIVIGGGTAGLVMASRLSETARVAVIEAGGYYEVDNGNYSTVPGLALASPFLSTAEDYPANPKMDWGFLSASQPHASDRIIHYPQGKTLGGSSALNTMAYHRGTKGAYQLWADLVADQSYTFSNLLKYFQKSSHFTAPNLTKRNTPNATVQYDATAFDNALGGPLQVSYSNYVDTTATWMARALQSIGLPESTVGFNSGVLSGFGAWITMTIDPVNATRSSSQTSYLEHVANHKNLDVLSHTNVTRILIDPFSKTAFGVEIVRQNGAVNFLVANEEVILSAGAFGSPRLLMLSGIGPADVLKEHRIPVFSNLPGVGQNLWDQVLVPVETGVNTPSGAQVEANPVTNAEAINEYLKDAAGPYSSPGAYIAFEKIPQELRSNFSSEAQSALAWFPSDWPEVEYVGGSTVNSDGVSQGVCTAVLVAPLSRGNVTIVSSNFADQPVIDMGWFSHPADREVAVAAIKRCREALASKEVASVVTGPEVVPGASIQTDDEILAFAEAVATPIFHAAGTCAMGKKGDPNAVVDTQGRVFGVNSLRVVDSSIFPIAIPGHPQSSVYMLAEKIADDIKSSTCS